MTTPGARWQKAQQLLHHPKADALTIAAVVHLQEEMMEGCGEVKSVQVFSNWISLVPLPNIKMKNSKCFKNNSKNIWKISYLCSMLPVFCNFLSWLCSNPDWPGERQAFRSHHDNHRRSSMLQMIQPPSRKIEKTKYMARCKMKNRSKDTKHS